MQKEGAARKNLKIKKLKQIYTEREVERRKRE
jgi:hypothetical protein